MVTVTQNQGTALCEVMTKFGQSLEESSAHNNTEPTDCTV